MPSGAKKRKAAKKKKQLQSKEPPRPSNTNNLGEEDLKQDDKESDSDSGSTASQDHQNQFTMGEVEKQFDGNNAKHDGGLMQADAESGSHRLHVVESHTRGLPRSSSSTSSTSSSSSVENYVVAPPVELVKQTDTDSLVETAVASPALSQYSLQVTTTASHADKATPSSVVKGKGEEKLLVLDEKGTPSDTVMENSEEKLDVVVDKATVSEVLVQTVLGKRDEVASAPSSELNVVSNGNSITNTNPKASVSLENEDKIELPDNGTTIDVGACADNVKESPAHDCHDHQLTTAHLPPQPVQTTSWKSCCGLFELFAG